MRSWPRSNLDGGYIVPAIFDSVDNVQKFRVSALISLKLVILRQKNNIKILPMIDFRATKVIPIKYLILLRKYISCKSFIFTNYQLKKLKTSKRIIFPIPKLVFCDTSLLRVRDSSAERDDYIGTTLFKRITITRIALGDVAGPWIGETDPKRKRCLQRSAIGHRSKGRRCTLRRHKKP